MPADCFTLDMAITHAKCMIEDDWVGTTREQWQKIAEFLEELQIRRDISIDARRDVKEEWDRAQAEFWKHAHVTSL